MEPYLTVPFSATNSGYGIEVDEEIQVKDAGNDIVSHAYKNQLATDEDVEKIQPMVITKNEEESRLWKEVASDIFQGILPIHQAGGVEIRMGIWDVLSELMGVEDIYCDILDEPERIHMIMERMTQSALAGIAQCNELGLFDTSQQECHCSLVYNDQLLPDFQGGTGADSFHSWNFAMAQLFTSVSPQATQEFEVDYMKRLTSQFGMVYYGCCERLDDRLDIIQSMPNIKKISCSPWSNPEKFAENLRKDVIMSAKPTPAPLATHAFFEIEAVEKELTRLCDSAKRNGIQLEFLLKDLSTVDYHPENLTKWADCAMKVCSRYG